MSSVHELSQFMARALLAHMGAICPVNAYCVATPPNWGLTITPNKVWNGSANKQNSEFQDVQILTMQKMLKDDAV
jgi:hypothetical protein